MKLFYMLTGRESDSDMDEFAELVKWMKQVRQRSAAPPRVVFSFGYMVRMPFTPLRHDPLVFQQRDFKAAGGRVKSICETNGFEFRLSSSWSEYAATQALASSEESLHTLLTQMAEAGCITDSGLGEQARQAVQRWIDAHGEGVSVEKPRDFPFPFAYLDDEGSRRFLHGQYERAKQGLDGGYPSREPGRPAAGPGRFAREARALDELMEKKHKLKPIYVTAVLPRETAGMGTPWIDAWLLRHYLTAHPAEADNVLSVTVPFAAGTAMNADDLSWFGQTVAAVIAWDPGRFARNLGGPFGGILDGFEPRAVKSTMVRVELPGAYFPDPAQRLADFLRDAHAPVTLSRSGDTATFTAAEKSLKKRILLAGTCRTTSGGAELHLVVGSRPFLQEWLESFEDSRSARRALVQIL
jgi:hypothetical protein